jgi:acetylornithine deacetylase/succinyl-diaminopimelate desuccinylase-like protein
MSRNAAIAEADRYFQDGRFLRDLARRVHQPTESQNPNRKAEMLMYLKHEMGETLNAIGFDWHVVTNPDPRGAPMLIAERHEAGATLTVLGYGHGDVVMGMEGDWRHGLSPWELKVDSGRIYGRGTADNKGQHTINLAAIQAVLRTRGRLGFSMKLLIEMSEEIGSPGLKAVCESHREKLKADVLIASDGPRLNPGRPTIFLGARGLYNFEIRVRLREGAHHSGNWGGLLANPAIVLAQALATITTPSGAIRISEWIPAAIPQSVRAALSDCIIDNDPSSPTIDLDWGEPGLTPAEKLCGWSSFEILALDAGDPRKPASAIPGGATAFCQLRHVVEIDPEEIVPALRRHLAAHGFSKVEVVPSREGRFVATRLDPANPWVRRVAQSLKQTTGKQPAVMPSVGGSLPNDVFADTLGLPTIWIPHSYGGCCQHAPNEHMLSSIAEEALQIMTGLYWDLGEVVSTREHDQDQKSGVVSR